MTLSTVVSSPELAQRGSHCGPDVDTTPNHRASIPSATPWNGSSREQLRL